MKAFGWLKRIRGFFVTLLYKKQFFDAYTKGDVKKVNELLGKGFNPNVRNKKGCCPLHLSGNLETVRALLKHGANPNAKDDLGKTPLHHLYDYKIIEFLLNNGADANQKDNLGRIPLHYSSYHTPKVVELLLSKTKNPESPDNYGKTSLDLASNQETKNILSKGIEAFLAQNRKQNTIQVISEEVKANAQSVVRQSSENLHQSSTLTTGSKKQEGQEVEMTNRSPRNGGKSSKNSR